MLKLCVAAYQFSKTLVAGKAQEGIYTRTWNVVVRNFKNWAGMLWEIYVLLFILAEEIE